jgi:flagellar basal-body rod modification protein FlgD
MAVQSIMNSSAPQTTGTTPAPGSALGRDAFLHLLVTQMKLQDPLEPMKNENMIAQLAQFSSLEQLQNMSTALQQNLDVNLALGQLLSNTMSTGLIGKQVHVPADSFDLQSGQPAPLGYRLNGDATKVSVSIYNDAGKLVRTLESNGAGAGATGAHGLEWDGRDDTGVQAPSGHYTFKVAATRADGSTIESNGLLVGRVSGIRYKDGTARVLLGATEVSLSEIDEILP